MLLGMYIFGFGFGSIVPKPRTTTFGVVQGFGFVTTKNGYEHNLLHPYLWEHLKIPNPKSQIWDLGLGLMHIRNIDPKHNTHITQTRVTLYRTFNYEVEHSFFLSFFRVGKVNPHFLSCSFVAQFLTWTAVTTKVMMGSLQSPS